MTLPVSPPVSLVEELRPAPAAWAVARQLADQPGLLFLDSALPEGPLGRYSFVAADPFAWLLARGDSVWLDGVRQPEAEPFAVLARLLGAHRQETIAGLPPFQGGAAGLFAYDLCHHLERLPRPRFDEFAVPDLAVGLYDWVVAFDHHSGRAWIISTGLPEHDPSRRRRRAGTRLEAVRRRLTRPAPPLPALVGEPVTPAACHPLPEHPEVGSSFTPAGFQAAIRRAIDYVHAGDCFQVNLAQRLLAPARLPPLAVYGQLRDRNPAPFAGYFDAGAFAVASASPERFVRVAGGRVQTRPIKGTRPRGATPDADRAVAAELLASPKDRAENVMIVDLLRNDLGRVCAFGSVRVEAVCRLESYRTVHHLVSEVSGQLRPGLGPVDLLRGVPRRIGHRGAQGAGDGDHRRTGADRTRAVLRQPRLPRLRRVGRHQHPDPHVHDRQRVDAVPRRRRDRRRLRPGRRIRRDAAQGRGPKAARRLIISNNALSNSESSRCPFPWSVRAARRCGCPRRTPAAASVAPAAAPNTSSRPLRPLAQPVRHHAGPPPRPEWLGAGHRGAWRCCWRSGRPAGGGSGPAAPRSVGRRTTWRWSPPPRRRSPRCA
ncbi:MAG: anthranilate synthase component I family protein [Gemmataceae bacterium]